MVKVVSIAIIKIYVGISAIEASAKIKKVVACRFETQRATDGTPTIPLDQPQLRLKESL